MDWDAFYQRYPVADVFVDTVYKWSPDRIRALQNERFLEVMQVGWTEPVLSAAVEKGRDRAGRHPKPRRHHQAADLQLGRRQGRPAGASAVRRADGILELRRAPVAYADQARDQRRHHRQAADHAARHRRVGVERARRLAHPLRARRAAGRRGADPGDLLARQSRLGDVQGLAGISRRPAADHRQRRGDAEPPPARDRLRRRHQLLDAAFPNTCCGSPRSAARSSAATCASSTPS